MDVSGTNAVFRAENAIVPRWATGYTWRGGYFMPTRVILDTDIGTDVDDCLALAFLWAPLGAGDDLVLRRLAWSTQPAGIG